MRPPSLALRVAILMAAPLMAAPGVVAQISGAAEAAVLFLLPRSRHLAASRGPSCPLSLPQQMKSIRAFAEMMPVFRHARCLNCHGGVDPLSEEHRGGDQLDPEIDRMANREEFEAQCQDCHDGLKGWTTPGEPVFFVGKSDEELCMQMKRFEKTGEKFVEHIHDDHGGIQFIAAGFAGDRALGEQGLKDYGLVAQKPPGTQAELTEKARKWVQILGDGYASSPECGCVKPKIELEMKSDLTVIAGGGRMTMQVSSTVPLRPDSSGFVFSGSAPLKHGAYSLTTPPGCRTDWKEWHGDLAVHEARFDVAADQRMTISLEVFPTQSGGTVRFICPQLPIAIPPAVLYWAGQWQNLHREDVKGRGYYFDRFKAASGLSLAGTRKLVGHKEVIRSKLFQGATFRSKTVFDFWWVGLEGSAH